MEIAALIVQYLIGGRIRVFPLVGVDQFWQSVVYMYEGIKVICIVNNCNCLLLLNMAGVDRVYNACCCDR